MLQPGRAQTVDPKPKGAGVGQPWGCLGPPWHTWLWGALSFWAGAGESKGWERREERRGEGLLFSPVPTGNPLGRLGADPGPGSQRQLVVAGCQDVAGAGWGDAGITTSAGKQLFSNHS